MKNDTLKKKLMAVFLSSMVLQGAIPVVLSGVLMNSGLSVITAYAAPSDASASTTNYGLTDEIRAAIKSVSVTPAGLGTQAAVTVRLYNGGTTENRVPEHELRVHTRGGVTYTLASSAGNKTSLQPKEIAELVYYAAVDTKELSEVDRISFVNVNLYTYPKSETVLLSMPANAVWYGTGKTAPAQPERLQWGEAFGISGLHSGLQYTLVESSVQNNADSGKAAVVTLLAENPGSGKETVPAFRIDGLASQKSYEGKRSITDTKVLEGGEKTYLHYTIPLDETASLTDLLVVSTDTFLRTGDSSTAVTLSTGKAIIAWPAGAQAEVGAGNYEWGKPIAIDPLTKLVDEHTGVALMEFHVHDNPGDGYKTAVAKFKLTNNSDIPVPTPVFGTELANSQGVSYQGSRQTNAVNVMNPGLSYVISYSFVVPQTENADNFTMRLLDGISAAPYHATAAALKVNAQSEETGNTFTLYPFELKLNDVQVGFTYSSLIYQYKFHLNLDVKQTESVVVDSNFSRLRFEIVDGFGRIVGSQDANLVGDKKLMSGKQTLEAANMTTDQMNPPYSVNVYEVIDTPSGTAKRFLAKVR